VEEKMETEECPQNHPHCRHQIPQWQTRMAIIPQTMGFLITCDIRLLPMGEFLHVAKLMHQAAVDYLKEEGIIIETRLPGLRLVTNEE
jgi:hypothetical protein